MWDGDREERHMSVLPLGGASVFSTRGNPVWWLTGNGFPLLRQKSHSLTKSRPSPDYPLLLPSFQPAPGGNAYKGLFFRWCFIEFAFSFVSGWLAFPKTQRGLWRSEMIGSWGIWIPNPFRARGSVLKQRAPVSGMALPQQQSLCILKRYSMTFCFNGIFLDH